MIVVDSSVVVAALLSNDRHGTWAASVLTSHEVAAPQLLTFEVANVLRRHAAAQIVSLDIARLAHGDLVQLDIEYWPYHAFASRAWQLRDNLAVYDASFVALAELLVADLYTLDTRITSAPGVACRVMTDPT